MADVETKPVKNAGETAPQREDPMAHARTEANPPPRTTDAAKAAPEAQKAAPEAQKATPTTALPEGVTDAQKSFNDALKLNKDLVVEMHKKEPPALKESKAALDALYLKKDADPTARKALEAKVAEGELKFLQDHPEIAQMQVDAYKAFTLATQKADSMPSIGKGSAGEALDLFNTSGDAAVRLDLMKQLGLDPSKVKAGDVTQMLEDTRKKLDSGAPLSEAEKKSLSTRADLLGQLDPFQQTYDSLNFMRVAPSQVRYEFAMAYAAGDFKQGEATDKGQVLSAFRMAQEAGQDPEVRASATYQPLLEKTNKALADLGPLDANGQPKLLPMLETLRQAQALEATDKTGADAMYQQAMTQAKSMDILSVAPDLKNQPPEIQLQMLAQMRAVSTVYEQRARNLVDQGRSGEALDIESKLRIPNLLLNGDSPTFNRLLERTLNAGRDVHEDPGVHLFNVATMMQNNQTSAAFAEIDKLKQSVANLSPEQMASKIQVLDSERQRLEKEKQDIDKGSMSDQQKQQMQFLIDRQLQENKAYKDDQAAALAGMRPIKFQTDFFDAAVDYSRGDFNVANVKLQQLQANYPEFAKGRNVQGLVAQNELHEADLMFNNNDMVGAHAKYEEVSKSGVFAGLPDMQKRLDVMLENSREKTWWERNREWAVPVIAGVVGCAVAATGVGLLAAPAATAGTLAVLGVYGGSFVAGSVAGGLAEYGLNRASGDTYTNPDGTFQWGKAWAGVEHGAVGAGIGVFLGGTAFGGAQAALDVFKVGNAETIFGGYSSTPLNFGARTLSIGGKELLKWGAKTTTLGALGAGTVNILAPGLALQYPSMTFKASTAVAEGRAADLVSLSPSKGLWLDAVAAAGTTAFKPIELLTNKTTWIAGGTLGGLYVGSHQGLDYLTREQRAPISREGQAGKWWLEAVPDGDAYKIPQPKDPAQ